MANLMASSAIIISASVSRRLSYCCWSNSGCHKSRLYAASRNGLPEKSGVKGTCVVGSELVPPLDDPPLVFDGAVAVGPEVPDPVVPEPALLSVVAENRLASPRVLTVLGWDVAVVAEEEPTDGIIERDMVLTACLGICTARGRRDGMRLD